MQVVGVKRDDPASTKPQLGSTLKSTGRHHKLRPLMINCFGCFLNVCFLLDKLSNVRELLPISAARTPRCVQRGNRPTCTTASHIITGCQPPSGTAGPPAQDIRNTASHISSVIMNNILAISYSTPPLPHPVLVHSCICALHLSVWFSKLVSISLSLRIVP